jgi:hypothetical protein
MIVQHGDVIAFKADMGRLEISVKMEGFGMSESLLSFSPYLPPFSVYLFYFASNGRETS